VEVWGIELRRWVVAFENEFVVFVGSGFEKSALEDTQDDIVEEVAGRRDREEVSSEEVRED
jgi:hypothetical protein